MLEYKIISSNGYNIYNVKIYVEKDELKASCTCPAGKKAGLFCKHISSLLNGDKSNIIEPSDSIELLEKLLVEYPNSNISKKNNEYLEKRDPDKYKKGFIYNNVEINNIIDLYNYLETIIGNELSISMVGENKLRVHNKEYLKNGKLKQNDKNAIIVMHINGDYYSFTDRYFKDWKKAGEYYIKNIENYANNRTMFVESERSKKNKEYIILDKSGNKINEIDLLFKYMKKNIFDEKYNIRYLSKEEDYDKANEAIYVFRNKENIIVFNKYLNENTYWIQNCLIKKDGIIKDFNNFGKACKYFINILEKDLNINIELKIM